MLTETINPDGSEAAAAPPLDGGQGRSPSLAVSGVVLTKAQLLAALSAFVPNATDFVPLPGGEHFSILFGGDSRRA